MIFESELFLAAIISSSRNASSWVTFTQCMYVYIYVYMYVCMYVCMKVHKPILYMYVNKYLCTYVVYISI